MAEKSDDPPAKIRKTVSNEAKESDWLEGYFQFDYEMKKIPNGYHLVKVDGLKAEHNAGCYSLKDVLSMDSQQLISSVQFNYCIALPWLLDQYPSDSRQKPLLIVTGSNSITPVMDGIMDLKCKHIVAVQARLPIAYGTHHTKMILLRYTTGLRVVIHTSNLVPQDWLLKTQGMWMSPLLPKIVSSDDTGASATGGAGVGENSAGVGLTNEFQSSLIKYLRAYNLKQLDSVIQQIKLHDFSQVKNVELVASVPGRHVGEKMKEWGHMRLRHLMKPVPSKDMPIYAQFSSIVFPSVENVRESLEGYLAGGSLPYHSSTAKKQPYLTKFMYPWSSSRSGRTRASPHIKSYCRLTKDGSKIAWFLLTSANLSKAAWGSLEKNNTQLMIRSYELGVLFRATEKQEGLEKIRKNCPPFDSQVEAYSSTTQPWITDLKYSMPDNSGQTWPV